MENLHRSMCCRRGKSMGVKSRVRSMQRGAQKRSTDKPVTNKELYAVSPPKLTDDEIAHFQFGARNIDDFFRALSPVLEACHKNGLAAGGVAKILNKQQIRTACNAPWTPRLAWFLMKTWRTVNLRPRQSSAATQPRPNSVKSGSIERAVERSSKQQYRNHLKAHFKNPVIGDAFPELAELKARLERQTK